MVSLVDQDSRGGSRDQLEFVFKVGGVVGVYVDSISYSGDPLHALNVGTGAERNGVYDQVSVGGLSSIRSGSPL